MSTPSRLAVNTLARTVGAPQSQFRCIHSTAKAGRSVALGTSESRHTTSSKEGLGYLAPRAEKISHFRNFSNVLVPRAPGVTTPSSAAISSQAPITTHAFSTGGERNATAVRLPNIADYTPKFDFPAIQVPFLPDNFNPYRKPEAEPIVSKPIIYTVADTSTHIAAPSALTEMLDNNSITLSFQDYTRESGPAINKLPSEDALGSVFRDVLGEQNLKVIV